MLLPETGPEGAGVLVERLRTALSGAFTGVRSVTASVGAVSFVEPPHTADELIRVADSLMYEAKAAGKDQTRLAVVQPPATTAAQTSGENRGAASDRLAAS